MAFFIKLKLNYHSKIHGYSQFSFWIPKVLTEIYFFQIFLNHAKNIPVLVSITDRKPEYHKMRRTYAQ